MSTESSVRPVQILSLRNERAARRLGWTPESAVTWREFLEQYPYQAREIAAAARRDLSTAA
jgi:hypothetical protein